MRDRQLMVRLAATMLFGLLVLSLLTLLSVQMAAHYLQGVAEGAIRQAFSEDARAGDGDAHRAVCLASEIEAGDRSECDPRDVQGERSLRYAACGRGGFPQLLGRQWICAAKFNDETTLEVRVSLGLGRHELELVLPPPVAGEPPRRSR